MAISSRHFPPAHALLLVGLLITTSSEATPRLADKSAPTNQGGIYGYWLTDEYGMPAFYYTFDELTDPLSPWFNTEGEERRDHFQLFGNHRINVVAFDYGYVSLFGNERGATFMNRFDPDQLNLGGGYSYLHAPGSTFATAHLLAPDGMTFERTFGMGYFEVTTSYEGIQVRHRLYAPFGDDPVVIDEVEITNLTSSNFDISHYEYWDVNRHQLMTEWIRSGSTAAEVGDTLRDGLNARFFQKAELTDGVLIASMSPKPTYSPPAEEQIAGIDGYPPDIFLAQLVGTADDYYLDQEAFFGTGSAERPEAVEFQLEGSILRQTDAYGQPAMLAMRSDIGLAPFSTHRLRFAYGYVAKNWDLSQLARFSEPDADLLEESMAGWSASLARFSADFVSDAVARESLWRSYQLQGSTVYHDYYEGRVTPQGSAYLYLSGADGAPRDQALFTLPLVYLDPTLARDNLRLIANLQNAESGAITYSFTGHGVNESAFIHRFPSDLDLFFLLGLTEYLAATGDIAFLQESQPFYPKDSDVLPPGASSLSLLDHARAAMQHLETQVGLGEERLVRVGDGDWSDGIVYRNPYPRAIANTIRDGESVPNSQMALFVLPRTAGWFENVDPTLASRMRSFAEALRDPTRATFSHRWFGRAYMRDSQNRSFLEGNDQESDASNGANYIDLEAQPWGLLADLLTDDERQTLLDEIEMRLDDDSPIGPRLLEDGQVWPAISGLMTWAYARYRPDSGWRSLSEHLYQTHADVFPETWMGILSGPDGWISSGQENEGGTWYSAFTPMTDFPVANMNPDAMWLLSLIRLAGIEPEQDGFSITPRREDDAYQLELPLMRLDVDSDAILLAYHAKNEGSLIVRMAVPVGADPHLTVNGKGYPVSLEGAYVTVPLSFHSGETHDISLEW